MTICAEVYRRTYIFLVLCNIAFCVDVLLQKKGCVIVFCTAPSECYVQENSKDIQRKPEKQTSPFKREITEFSLRHYQVRCNGLICTVSFILLLVSYSLQLIFIFPCNLLSTYSMCFMFHCLDSRSTRQTRASSA